MSNKKILIMAAGTGGHIFPGLAIAKLMQKRGWNVAWLGTKVGMEHIIVPSNQIPFYAIDFKGLRGKGFKHFFVQSFKMIASFFSCLSLMRSFKPDVVLGMGGYVTFPGGVAAFMCGRKLVVMNADSELLLSNQLLKPFAKKIIFGLPSQNLTQEKKIVVAGNPIREDILKIDLPEHRYANRQGKLRILIIGGSLGAKALNDNLPLGLALIPEELRPIVTHQSGKAHVDKLKKLYQENGVDVEVCDFIDDMPHYYSQVDLVICRAGAITVSELTNVGLASILIPLVASSTSHQRQNAIWMNDKGAAIHLPQAELNPEKLAHMIQNMSREQCLQLAQKAYELNRRNAGETVVEILEELV